MLKSELPRAGSMAFHPVLDCFFEAFQGHVTHRHSLLQIHCEQRRPMLASSVSGQGFPTWLAVQQNAAACFFSSVR